MKPIFRTKIIYQRKILKSRKTSSRREENKSFYKALKVQMVEYDGSDNNSEESTTDEVDVMSRNFK